MKYTIFAVLILVAFLVAACSTQLTPQTNPTEAAPNMPNPASEFCVARGYQSEIRDEAGGQVGYCLFPDGSECEEWAYYNGSCLPASSEREPAIVFDSNRGGDYRNLYVMDEGGANVVCLTAGETNSIAGPWSPMTSGSGPAGSRIDYTAFGLTTSDIWVINADGSGQVNLTDTPDIDEGFPAWSPDGNHIAFTSRRDGNNEIYVMQADGANPSRWTDNPADDFAPAWSPDGTMIAFVSDRDREAGIYDLYIMDVLSTAVTRLTDDAAIDYSPAWSPDGTRIAYRSHHDGAADIYVIRIDSVTRTSSAGPMNLTNDPADDWAPAWSPDGRLIAFQTNRDGNWEIYTMTTDGSQITNLTNDPADDQMPFWRAYPVDAGSSG